MKLYQKLHQQVKDQNLTTVTLDIFDTILMRKIWPEDLQFYKVATKWQPLFQKHFAKTITADELYSFRIYARQELIAVHRRYNLPKTSDFDLNPAPEYDVTLRTWFSKIIDLLAVKHKIKTYDRAALLREMIKVELDTEKSHLTPNRDLINCLARLKRQHRHLKIFFVSDMYLTAKEITELLNHFHITIFDGGITSTEAKYTKATGALYDYLHASKILCPEFNLSQNLHIGDNRISDYNHAIISGSSAILYHKPRLRTLRTACGRLHAHRIRSKIIRSDRQTLTQVNRHQSHPAEIWYAYGQLFAQPLFTFLTHLTTAAAESPHTTFLMVSSEAVVFQKYGKLLNPNFPNLKNIRSAEKLNRKCAIRALLWTLIKTDNFEYNLEAIFKTANLGEVDGSRREFYDFLFGRDYAYSEMTTNYRSETNFYKALLKEIKTADSKFTEQFKAAYDYVKSFLPKDNSSKVTIVDVGWGGTVQVLFSQFANLHGYRSEIEGLYIGVMPGNRFGVCELPSMEGYLMPDVKYGKDRALFCAVLWEYPYTNKPQFSGDLAHLEQIRRGIKSGLEIFNQAKLAPKSYFDLVAGREIKRLVANPTKKEAQVIGSIKFDMSFANPVSFQIVNMNYRKNQIYRLFLRHPKKVVHDIIFERNHWSGGFIKYYRIPFVKTLVKLYGKLVGKTLI